MKRSNSDVVLCRRLRLIRAQTLSTFSSDRMKAMKTCDGCVPSKCVAPTVNWTSNGFYFVLCFRSWQIVVVACHLLTDECFVLIHGRVQNRFHRFYFFSIDSLFFPFRFRFVNWFKVKNRLEIYWLQIMDSFFHFFYGFRCTRTLFGCRAVRCTFSLLSEGWPYRVSAIFRAQFQLIFHPFGCCLLCTVMLMTTATAVTQETKRWSNGISAYRFVFSLNNNELRILDDFFCFSSSISLSFLTFEGFFVHDFRSTQFN